MGRAIEALFAGSAVTLSTWLRTTLKVLLNALVLAFVGYVLWSSLRGHEADALDVAKRFDAGTALALLALGVGNMLVGHLAWHTITLRLGIHIPYWDSLRVWGFSLLGRYVPGKVMLLVARTYAYRQRGQPAVWVAYAVILEHLFALASAIVVLLVSLTQLDLGKLEHLRWLGWIGLLPLALLLSPRLMNWGIGLLARRLGTEARRDLSTGDFLLFLGIFLCGWIVLGVGNYVLIWRIGAIGWNYFLFVTGAHALAGIVGVLSLFAPSGIGVRDGLMFFFLSRIMPAYQATLASVGLRLWLTGCELLVIGLAWIGLKLPSAPKVSDERSG
jgi:hypothetical protein